MGELRSFSIPPRGEVARGEGAQRDLLTFLVSDEEYALGIEYIREIIKMRPVTEVPRVPPFVAGIIAVRGVVMPVLDLRLRLRLPAQPLSRQARVLVVMHSPPGDTGPGEPYGLLVDQVNHVVRLQEGDIEPPTMLSGHEADFVAGIGRIQQEGGPEARAQGGRATGVLPQGQRQMIILLDLPRVLSFDIAAGLALHGTDRSDRADRSDRPDRLDRPERHERIDRLDVLSDPELGLQYAQAPAGRAPRSGPAPHREKLP
jgi:chemotaxis signal transduction protein